MACAQTGSGKTVCLYHPNTLLLYVMISWEIMLHFIVYWAVAQQNIIHFCKECLDPLGAVLEHQHFCSFCCVNKYLSLDNECSSCGVAKRFTV